MLARAAAPLCDALVLTSSQNPRALPPPTLQSLARQLRRAADARSCADPRAALAAPASWPGPTAS